MWVREISTGYCAISTFLPEGYEEITAEEFQAYINPPKSVIRAEKLMDRNISPEDKRRYLYETLRYELKDDGSCEEDENRPFYNPAMTVDELQQEYGKYVGDDDQRAQELLTAKKKAKDYIRSIVS